MLRIAHGLPWWGSMGTVVTKLENGELGSVYTAHIKSVAGETWEACSRLLREDENVVTMTVADVTKSYTMDNIESVVEMFRYCFDGIPETTYEAEKRMKRCSKKKEV